MIEPIKLLATLFLLINSFLIYAQEHATPKKHITPEYLRGEEVRAVQIYSDVLPTVVTIITSRLVFTEERGLTQQESIGHSSNAALGSLHGPKSLELATDLFRSLAVQVSEQR